MNKQILYICHGCQEHTLKKWHDEKPNFCGWCGSDKITIDNIERRDELLQACYKFIEDNMLEDCHVEYDGALHDGHHLLSDICTATLTPDEWDAGYCHDCSEDDCEVSLDDSCKKTREKENK